MTEILDRLERKARFRDEQEATEIRRKLETLASNILIEVGERDRRFQSTLILSGSVYEKAKVLKPDEFDFMVRLDSLPNRPSFHSCYKGDGYAKLKLDGDDWQEFKDGGGFFSPNLVCRHFKKLVNASFSTVVVPDGLQIARASREMLEGTWGPVYADVLGSIGRQNPSNVLWSETHGPATTVYIHYQGSTYKDLMISVDLTLTLEHPLSEIPVGLSTFPQEMKSRVERCGFHLVPSGFDFWRISFSMAEKETILSSPDGVTICYRVLKMLRDDVSNDLGLDASLIPSYFLKTVLLAQLSDELPWERQFWSQRITASLDCLLEAVKVKTVPSYFIPGCNLLSKDDHENRLRQILLEEMLNVIRGLEKNHQSEDVEEIRRTIRVLQVVDLLDYLMLNIGNGSALTDLWNKMFGNVGTIPGTRRFGWYWNQFTDLESEELSENAYRYLVQTWYLVEKTFQQLQRTLHGELSLLVRKFYTRTCSKKKKFEDEHRDVVGRLVVRTLPLHQIFYDHLDDLIDSFMDIDGGSWSSLHKAVPSAFSTGFSLFGQFGNIAQKEGSAQGLAALKSFLRVTLHQVPEQALMTGIVDFVSQIFIHGRETLRRELDYISIPELDLD